MYARIFGILSIGVLAACGGSGGNPLTGDEQNNTDGVNSNPITGREDDGAVTDPGTDPTTLNSAFLFNEGAGLIANQFEFLPGATAAENRIRINNLPFDGVSSQGNFYTPKAGVVLPNGQAFENTPGTGEDPYLAVVLVSPTGSGALVGAVGTNAYRDFGYGGAYAERPSSALPPNRTAAYIYTGEYAGVRVLRDGADAIQLTTGDAMLQVDLQDVDVNGAIKGRITGRQVRAENGALIGSLNPIILNETRIEAGTATTTPDGSADTRNADGTNAQTGSWKGLFSGPNGEEIVGYVLVNGKLPNNEPTGIQTGDVTGREVGGFIVQRP